MGAASRGVALSWPRVDLESARSRVPSFYGLEAARAAEGRLPGFDELRDRAERGGRGSQGWHAPERPDLAIDDTFPTRGDACQTGLSGPCAPGSIQCISGAPRCVGLVQATAEVCDGVDNDCDGSIDETFTNKGATCSVGQGVCANAGTHTIRDKNAAVRVRFMTVSILLIRDQGSDIRDQGSRPGIREYI